MADAHADRQLLAIMFTDVVGYTAITERDEASAVRIREAHRDLIRTLVGQFDGEVVDVTGDESLSIFASALRAVDCAMAVQGALRSHPDLRERNGAPISLQNLHLSTCFVDVGPWKTIESALTGILCEKVKGP